MYVRMYVAIMKRRERESQPNLKFDSSMHVLCSTVCLSVRFSLYYPKCTARLARSGEISLISPRTLLLLLPLLTPRGYPSESCQPFFLIMYDSRFGSHSYINAEIQR